MAEEKKAGPRGYKVTLSTGKVVFLREMLISHQNLAIKAVGQKAGENQALLGMMMNQELLKLLIHSVDGKDLGHKDLEKLDDVLKVSEYTQLLKVIEQIVGGNGQEAQIDFVLT